MRSAVSPLTLFSNRNCLAYYERIDPVTHGHVIIVSKHPGGWTQKTPDERIDAFDLADRVMSFLLKEFKPSGFSVGFSLGRIAGQLSKEWTLHVIPKYGTNRRYGSVADEELDDASDFAVLTDEG